MIKKSYLGAILRVKSGGGTSIITSWNQVFFSSFVFNLSSLVPGISLDNDTGSVVTFF